MIGIKKHYKGIIAVILVLILGIATAAVYANYKHGKNINSGEINAAEVIDTVGETEELDGWSPERTFSMPLTVEEQQEFLQAVAIRLNAYAPDLVDERKNDPNNEKIAPENFYCVYVGCGTLGDDSPMEYYMDGLIDRGDGYLNLAQIWATKQNGEFVIAQVSIWTNEPFEKATCDYDFWCDRIDFWYGNRDCIYDSVLWK